jgi:hypothetical protein
MSSILDAQGKHTGKSPKREAMDNILFRWIILVLMSIAAKVLNKEEVMNIYVLIGKEAGHSPIVDGFHTMLLQMMEHGEKNDGE